MPKNTTDLTFEATGTVWRVRIFETVSPSKLSQVLNETIAHYSLIFSRFDPESALYRLNQSKVLHSPPLELVYLLNQCYLMSAITHGAVTPEIGAILEKQGYGHTEQTLPLISQPLHISTEQITLPNTVLLDLGCCAKGYIVDRVAEKIYDAISPYFIINAGGDIYASSDNGNPIEVGIEHPLTREIVQHTQLLHSACCSSSNELRTWQHHGQHHAHIIAQNPPLGVSVAAKKAGLADLLTTALFTTGTQNLPQLQAQYGEFDYIIF